MKSVTNQPAALSESQRVSPIKRPWYRHRLLIVGLAILVCLAAGSGIYLIFLPRVQPLTLPKLLTHTSTDDLGLANWRDYSRPLSVNPLTDPALPTSPQIHPQLALLEYSAGIALLQQRQIAKGLGYLQAAVESSPDNLRYANSYRLSLRGQKLYTDELNFFSHLFQAHPTLDVQLSVALAYVDLMRSCPLPPDGLVCQAQNSSYSITQLNTIIKKQPYNIIARYARGLNHLYWPRLMEHLPMAQQDLSYAVALTHPLNSVANSFTDDAYTALGDVFAKDNQPDAARNVWQNGLQVVPHSSLLQGRLAIPKEKLLDEEDGTLRGLGVYVETDISIFWTKGR